MSDAETALTTIRRNRTAWFLRRQLTKVQQDVVVNTNTGQGTDPALAPLGTEVADYSDEFDSTLLSGKWTWVNQGTSTATFRDGRLLLTPQVSGGAGNSVRLLVRTAFPTGSWCIRTKVGFNATIVNAGAGLVVYRAGAGTFTFQSALVRVAGAPMSCRLLTAYWTNVTTFGTVVRDDNPPLIEQRMWYMQMRYDGTKFYFDYSADNVVFFNITNVVAATALGGAPTAFGIAANVPSAVTPAAANTFEWFRCYSGSNLNQDAV